VDYITLAKLGLQLIVWCMNKYHDQQQFDAGQEHQIVETAKAVLGMTAEGKRLLEKINAMSDSDLNDLTDAVGRAGKS
jgi:hypothetical protein